MPVLDRVTARVEVTDGATDIESAGEAQAWSVSPVFLFAVLALLLVLAVVIGRASKRRARDQRSSSAENSAVEEPFLP
jgi:flagellar biogenesis protein FliO